MPLTKSKINLTNNIYCENCIDTMSRIDSNAIDLVVTSPPYDNMRTYGGHGFEDFEIIAKSLYRILKMGGVVVWVVGDETINGNETGTSFPSSTLF